MTSPYAKGIVAVIGVAVTAALGIIPANTITWQVLTVVSAVVTAVGVYLIPNTPTPAAAKPAAKR